MTPDKQRLIAIVAGEASGDQLGASLIRALKASLGESVRFVGVGGPAMEGEGLSSFFPQTDIAVMGLGPVLKRLPLILMRIRQTAWEIAALKPDLLVTIDSPDFCKRVAKRVRGTEPSIPIIHWVCPSVWAWRPGRAPAMRPYIDHVLCLLPFEPEALKRLKGPPGTYIGHPLIERAPDLRPQSSDEQAARANAEKPVILLLPGSRGSEIKHLLSDFLETIRIAGLAGAELVLPTLPHLEARVRATVEASGLNIAIVLGDEAKRAAFRRARAAIAASGTVTLELAVAQIPMVTAYRVAGWEAFIARRLITADSAILPSLILKRKFVPEYIQEAAQPSVMGAALAALVPDGEARAAQLTGFAAVDAALRENDVSPSARAAEIALRYLSA
jgi:lipid-A-disaccharide synthase